MDVKAIQAALREQGFDGWLLCDFRNRDFLAYRVLGLDFEKLHSRRWYYYIPAKGSPKRLACAVEPNALDTLPGAKRIFRPGRTCTPACAGCWARAGRRSRCSTRPRTTRPTSRLSTPARSS